MRIAYARISTDKQVTDRQIDMLHEVGYDRLIEETYTGTKKDRQGLNQLMDIVRDGDTVIVESISRLGRKTLDILSIIEELDKKGVKFISLKENMDTSTATGKAMFQMMCVIAELERNLLAERVREGLEASKKRGTRLGRPTVDNDLVERSLRLYDSGEWSIKEIIKTTGISQGSLYRAINKRKVEEV